jgi:hypothetical protein
LGTIQGIFSSGKTANDSDYFAIEFDASDRFVISERQSVTFVTYKETTRLFRDVTAWMAIQVAVDTTQADSANRFKLFINGLEETTFSTNTVQNQNTDTWINSTELHRVGNRTNSTGTQYLDGYLAEVVFIDGQALTASDFGQTNGNGYWIPKAYAGTYGTNGFYLDFSLTGNLGHDVSGNANDFFSSGSPAQTLDSPMNDAVNDVGLYPILMSAKNAVISEAGQKATIIYTSVSGPYGQAFSTLPFNSEDTDGWYWETTMVQGDWDSSFGICRALGGLGYNSNGMSSPQFSFSNFNNNGGVGTYVYVWDGGFTNGNPVVSNGDTIKWFLRDGKLWVGHAGGVWWNSGDPDAGTGYRDSGITGDVVVAVTGAPHYDMIVRANFGLTAYIDTPPTGAKKIHLANFSAPAVPNPEDEYYVTTVSHTNGATTDVSLSFSVSGGAMARIKRTNDTGSWYVVDTVRGANKFILWDDTVVEDTATWSNQALTGTTLTLPSALATGTYLVEVFKVGSYFQIKTYTGTGVAHTESFSSALATAPGMFVLMYLGAGNGNGVYHSAVGATKILNAADTSATGTSTTYLNDTTPTTTGFTVGTANITNQSGVNFVAYAWANAGPYAFGSYVGNGSADGPVVYWGGKADSFFTKRTDFTDNWNYWVWHSSIRNYNPHNQELDLDYFGVPGGNAIPVDFLATGFKNRNAGTPNVSGSIYVYAAFGIHQLNGGGTAQGRAV